MIGWQIDNELNCHVDDSFAPSDHLAFRAWCQERYGTLDNLEPGMGYRLLVADLYRLGADLVAATHRRPTRTRLCCWTFTDSLPI